MPTAPSEDEVIAWFDSLSNWGRWGSADELGTLNLIMPEVRTKAVATVAEGLTVSCSWDVPTGPIGFERTVTAVDLSADSRGRIGWSLEHITGWAVHGYAITQFLYSAAIGTGNTVLYGHDDIEGSVFGRLADLGPGDQIVVTLNSSGESTVWRVTARTIVAPNAVKILDATSDVRLTLFTCWPTWVDTKRVVITAVPE